MQVKQLFPRDGSKLTPPHPSEDFKFKDYCPAAFRQLRAVFDLDSAEYMLSICGECILQISARPQKGLPTVQQHVSTQILISC